ncbi:ETS translocation variant 4 [Platysternon megacephalum]|uniref:ETS translocation variant 4 n=1 Tax=Platysternon megacephalum TaxID=55544 RepID=A0A4D9DP90_9SAUR|nr:ETS translocation variant 4 [Platysternon megacephalum]
MYVCPLTLPCLLLPQHIHFWLHSKKTQERARAIQSSDALLEFTTSLPGFDVFGEIFTEGQRRTFLQVVLLAIHDPQLCVSQAGLMLTYSILGEAGQLIGDEVTKEGSTREGPPGPFTTRPLKVTPIPSHVLTWEQGEDELRQVPLVGASLSPRQLKAGQTQLSSKAIS